MEASKTLSEPRTMTCKACITEFTQAPELPCPECHGPTEPHLGACDTCGADTDDSAVRTCVDCAAYEDAEERAFELHRERDW